MHLEILVEDLSGKKALDILVPRIIGGQDTFRVHSYKGIGRIPKNMRDGNARNSVESSGSLVIHSTTPFSVLQLAT